MRVFLVNRNGLFLEGLQNLLKSYGVEVVKIVPRELKTLTNGRLPEPDVIITNLPGNIRDGLKEILLIKTRFPSAPIIVFVDCYENLQAAFQNGAYSYLLTDINGDELLGKLCELANESE